MVQVQIPACVWVARAAGVPDEFALGPIAAHLAMFGLSHYVLRTDKYFDITGEVTFLLTS